MNQAYGLTGFVNVPALPVIPKPARNPTSSDVLGYVIGQLWVNTSSNASFQLTSVSGTTATWVALGSSSGTIDVVLGTANQVTVTSVGNTATVSLPSAITTPGSLTTTTSLTATLGNITATNGNLVLSTAGNKLSIATGANASVGTSTLSGGTVTVSTTAVTASSIILLTRQSIGATGAAAVGNLTVGTVTAGTSFVINAVQAANATALQASDVSVIGWMIIN